MDLYIKALEEVERDVERERERERERDTLSSSLLPLAPAFKYLGPPPKVNRSSPLSEDLLALSSIEMVWSRCSIV